MHYCIIGRADGAIGKFRFRESLAAAMVSLPNCSGDTQ
jgi:hypothetical protein